MNNKNTLPKIGVGIIITNEKGEILIGKRKGSHANLYSIPGGHFERGETFEEAAAREAKEEMGIDIRNPKVIALTNNLKTYKKEGVHHISVILLVTDFIGVPKNIEPDKCDGWFWVNPKKLPLPHFDASQRGVECWLAGEFYKKYE